MREKGIANINDDRFTTAALDQSKRRELIRKLERTRSAGTGVMLLGALTCLIVIWSGKSEVVPVAVCVMMMGSLTFTHADGKVKSLKILDRQETDTEHPFSAV